MATNSKEPLARNRSGVPGVDVDAINLAQRGHGLLGKAVGQVLALGMFGEISNGSTASVMPTWARWGHARPT